MNKILGAFIIILTFCCNENICAQQNGSFTDNRDGKEYKWVKIGSQIWMAENLAYLPRVYSPFDEDVQKYTRSGDYSIENFSNAYWFVPGYSSDNVEEAKKTEEYNKYGVLYNYSAADSACPCGWHLPTDDEWKELERHIGMTRQEINTNCSFSRGTGAFKLKSVSGWEDDSNTDEYGFNILSSKSVFMVPDFSQGAEFVSDIVGFWTSSEYTDRLGYPLVFYRGFFKESQSIMRCGQVKSFGLSVRCIKD